jgi:hypothetical protein
VQRGSYVAPSRQTVGEFLDRWIDGVRSELAVTAWTNYRDVIGLYVTPISGAGAWSISHRRTSSPGTHTSARARPQGRHAVGAADRARCPPRAPSSAR